MTGLTDHSVDVLSTDVVVNGIGRRSLRPRTRSVSLNVDDLARNTGLLEHTDEAAMPGNVSAVVSSKAKRQATPSNSKVVLPTIKEDLDEVDVSHTDSATTSGGSAFSPKKSTPVSNGKRKAVTARKGSSSKRQKTLDIYKITSAAQGDEDEMDLTEKSDVVKNEDISIDSGVQSTNNTTSTASAIVSGPVASNAAVNSSVAGAKPKIARKVNAASKSSLKATATPILRPEPCGQPIIHAANRQELCETLPFYRAYQSGAYTSNGRAHAMFLSLDASTSSFMGEEVVIARAGGHCAKNDLGIMEQVKDHSADEPSVESFRMNLKEKYPLALIVGKQNQECPTEIPYQFCVMDWFQVTCVWAEKNYGKVCYKFRFEKINRGNKSWWAPKDSLQIDTSIVPPACARQDCNVCTMSSKRVFEEGWMCLNENCQAFFCIAGTPPPEDLTYSAQFLDERTPWSEHMLPPYDLLTLRNQGAIECGFEISDTAASFSRKAWKGRICSLCGRCNSRSLWGMWCCRTPNCPWTLKPERTILSVQDVMDPFDEVYSGHAVPRDRYLPAVDMRDPEFVGGYRIHKYDFGGGNVVTHIHANGPENAAKNGADDLFRNLQKDGSIPLKRHALNTASGEMLASHFAVNYGMPYKYSVAVDSKPFNEAPSAIFSALKHLNQAAKSAVSDEGFKDFNEMLCVGYYEKGKMGYHDDGEKELGPTVASLSLGATAFMSIRLKKRYYTGITTKGNKYDHEAPVLPGCVLEAERKALNAKWGNVTPAEFDTLQKAFYKQHSRELNRNCPELLNMTLMHGDIMVMHGSDLQKYYEHQVVSPGLTRFALTCRHIDPDLVDPAYHWKAVWDPTATITTEEQPKEAATLQRYAPDWNMFRG